MNFKALITAAAVIATLSGCATQSDLDRANIQVKSMEEQMTALDMRTQRLEQSRQKKAEMSRSDFCFSNNLMFSEGAYYLGKTCTRDSGMMVYQAGRPVVYPLSWK